jgi:hypothetical protein
VDKRPSNHYYLVIAGRSAPTDVVLMNKRTVASLLWGLTTFCFYELAWSLAGAPRNVGPILAIAVGMLVYGDPIHVIWGAKSTRHIARIPDRAAAAGKPSVNSTN